MEQINVTTKSDKWKSLCSHPMAMVQFIAVHLAAVLTAGVVVMVVGYILVTGTPNLKPELFAWTYTTENKSMMPALVNTVCMTVLSLLMAVPVGVGAAIYLTEYASNRTLAAVIEFAAETLTGIPSILYGLVGMLIFVQLCGLGAGILAGGLTLVMMILPTILRTTQESLKTVPQAYRDGALALGAGKWRMVRTVVLPNAVDGIITGCILAVGRIVGESAALLFTAGFGLRLQGFLNSLRTSSATLTVALYVYASEQGKIDVAFAIAVILMLLTLLINIAAGLAGKKRKR